MGRQSPATKFVSPDGVLTYLVTRTDEGTSLGFQGVPSHTHGRILAELYGLSENEAIRTHIDALLNNELYIVIAMVDGQIKDIWTTQSIVNDKYKPKNEIITFRYWDGTIIHRDQ
jgi:hypothetical protein